MHEDKHATRLYNSSLSDEQQTKETKGYLWLWPRKRVDFSKPKTIWSGLPKVHPSKIINLLLIPHKGTSKSLIHGSDDGNLNIQVAIENPPILNWGQTCLRLTPWNAGFLWKKYGYQLYYCYQPSKGNKPGYTMLYLNSCGSRSKTNIFSRWTLKLVFNEESIDICVYVTKTSVQLRVPITKI